MTPWYEIARPHADIRAGDFNQDVFAADLGDVRRGQAPEDYNDPYLFFKKTYLTGGLENLLHQVYGRLATGKGPTVLELQTPFGGGKTHALLTIYHYLQHGQAVQSLLPDGVDPIDAATATIVGTHLNPSEGHESDGIRRHTLWGELAFQLGGADAYRQIEANDRDRVAPGKETLRPILEAYEPFTLLFDEVLEYVVRARGVDVGTESTLGAQTLSFLQELTEAVANTSHGLMLVTLPSSELEDFGEAKQRNLDQLERVFGRIESIEMPVQGEEIYAIIRQRLFEPVHDEAAVKEIVDRYMAKYQDHKQELPNKASEGDYRRRMEQAYPFHPDLIDTLYEKWGAFPSFQRTRGALRLLANVVEDLYQREEPIDLILPCDVNLDPAPIRREFISHIGQEYESVIGSDIAGHEAKAPSLDSANRNWKHLGSRIATAIFLHSFTPNQSDQGVPVPFIKLAVLRQDSIPAMVTEVLQQLSNELWYLNTEGERYYFSNVFNLNRVVVDKQGVIQAASVREEIERRVKQQLGTKLRSYLWPQSSDDIPDNRELKLAVIDPENRPDPSQLQDWLHRRTSSFRTYKNTIIYGLPEGDRLARLDDAVRRYLALKEIKTEIEEDRRPGMSEKRSEVERRLRETENDIPQQVRDLYRTAAVPAAGGELETLDLGRPMVGRESLDHWYWKELADEGVGKLLTRPPSTRMLTAKFLNNQDAIRLSDLVEQFYKDPGLPLLADAQLIAQAVAQGVQEGALGLASGSPDAIEPNSVRINESIRANDVQLTEDYLLLTAERAQAEQASAATEEASTAPSETDDVTDTEPQPAEAGRTPRSDDQATSEVASSEHEEKVPSYKVRASGISANRIADLHQGVLRPLLQEVGDFDFTIEIDVESEDGISKRAIEQQIEETLRQLGAQMDEPDDASDRP